MSRIINSIVTNNYYSEQILKESYFDVNTGNILCKEKIFQYDYIKILKEGSINLLI